MKQGTTEGFWAEEWYNLTFIFTRSLWSQCWEDAVEKGAIVGKGRLSGSYCSNPGEGWWWFGSEWQQWRWREEVGGIWEVEPVGVGHEMSVGMSEEESRILWRFLAWEIRRIEEPSVMMEKSRDRAYSKRMRSSIMDMMSLRCLLDIQLVMLNRKFDMWLCSVEEQSELEM